MLIEDYYGLILCSGGHLYFQKWKYDNDKHEGSYVHEEVTSFAYRFLFEPCALMPDVILKDVFLLVKHNCELFHMILGNWCKEYTKQALTSFNDPRKTPELKAVEIYKTICVEDNETSGLHKAEFHGIGVDEENPYWSLMLSAVEDLVHLPLQLCQKVPCYMTSDIEPSYILENVSYTLGEILYAIFWELSFCGSPEESRARKEEILQNVIDIKNGE